MATKAKKTTEAKSKAPIKWPLVPTATGKIDCAAVLEIAEQLRKEQFMYRVSIVELDKRMARHLKRAAKAA